MNKCGSITINGKICKNSIFNELSSPKCYIHYKQKYTISSITISRYYRGHRARRYINNIYKKLPKDIQNKILFIIREPLLLQKHTHSIIKQILINKFYKSNLYILREDPYTLFENIRYNCYETKEIYRLYFKYNTIADPFISKWLTKISHILISLCTIYNIDNYNATLNEFKYYLIEFYKLR